MRRFTLVLSSLLLLAACGSSDLHYTLNIQAADPGVRTDLAGMAARVVERRLMGMRQQITDGDVSLQGDNKLNVHVNDGGVAKQLADQLAQPFNMRIMVETDDTKNADINSDKFGSYKETGITEKDFDWVRVINSSTRGKGAVMLTFTAQGKQKLKKVFTDNKGKTIGIFVRGVLMSRKMVNDTDPVESITVDGVPSAELAVIFSEDVNTGLHVTFTPAS